MVVFYAVYDKHVALIQPGTEFGVAKLWYDQPKKQFCLLVTLEIEVADLTSENHKQVVGIGRAPATRKEMVPFILGNFLFLSTIIMHEALVPRSVD